MVTVPTWRIPTEKEVADMVEEVEVVDEPLASFDSDLWFCLDCGVSKNEDDMASWTPGLHVEETGANTGSCKQCFADMMRTVQITGREEQG
jgi:hypothetical protein|tara:strand:- start:43 stop:315 length:273 start_codon:yes stop_codon:yes gene_type:complete